MQIKIGLSKVLMIFFGVIPLVSGAQDLDPEASGTHWKRPGEEP